MYLLQTYHFPHLVPQHPSKVKAFGGTTPILSPLKVDAVVAILKATTIKQRAAKTQTLSLSH